MATRPINTDGATRPDAQVIREAAQWMTRLKAQPASPADIEACARWRRADPSHEYAWRKAEFLFDKLGMLSPELSVPVLTRDHAIKRRTTIKILSMAALAAPAVWLTRESFLWQRWQADYSTGTGQQHIVHLDDGSTVLLNTGTSLNVQFDRTERRLRLLAGEIMVTTNSRPSDSRPFIVETYQGTMQALGTRFMVRAQDNTLLTVLEHSVAVKPADFLDTPARIIEAGQKVRFDRDQISPVQAVTPQDSGWTEGVLYANDMPLGEFLEDLARYRPGVVRYSPAAGALRISGAFQLPDTRRILDIIAGTLPIQIRYRSQYWVQVDLR